MPVATFKVSISNIHSDDLPLPSAGKSLNAFVKVSQGLVKEDCSCLVPLASPPEVGADIAWMMAIYIYAACSTLRIAA